MKTCQSCYPAQFHHDVKTNQLYHPRVGELKHFFLYLLINIQHWIDNNNNNNKQKKTIKCFD